MTRLLVLVAHSVAGPLLGLRDGTGVLRSRTRRLTPSQAAANVQPLVDTTVAATPKGRTNAIAASG